jgi:hypothetical protein
MGDHLQHQKRKGKKVNKREGHGAKRAREAPQWCDALWCCGNIWQHVPKYEERVRRYELASRHDTCTSNNDGRRTRYRCARANKIDQ